MKMKMIPPASEMTSSDTDTAAVTWNPSPTSATTVTADSGSNPTPSTSPSRTDAISHRRPRGIIDYADIDNDDDYSGNQDQNHQVQHKRKSRSQLHSSASNTHPAALLPGLPWTRAWNESESEPPPRLQLYHPGFGTRHEQSIPPSSPPTWKAIQEISLPFTACHTCRSTGAPAATVCGVCGHGRCKKCFVYRVHVPFTSGSSFSSGSGSGSGLRQDSFEEYLRAQKKVRIG